MARASAHSQNLALSYADEIRRWLRSLCPPTRACPAVQHRRPDNRPTCSSCVGTFCKGMRARGLDDDGRALPVRLRPRCGARTRRGSACSRKVVPGRFRCRLHGGLSTGPRSAPGKARIAAAQRRRWAHWRAKQGTTADSAAKR